MANKDLKRQAHKIRGTNVYRIEDGKGICLVVSGEMTKSGVASEIILPWRYIRNALKRKEKGGD